MTQPDRRGDERAQLLGFLDYYRSQIIDKVEGITEEQARWKPAETANSLGAIVNHLARVEHWWFHAVFAGKPFELHRDRQDPLYDFHSAYSLPLAEMVERYQAECERSRGIVAAAPSLDAMSANPDREVNLRWILLHMLEETARHAGHMDITRELIDGTVER